MICYRGFGEFMGKKSALALSKVEDTYLIEHRGYPAGGMLRFHAALGVAAVLMCVPLAVEVHTSAAQAYFAATALLMAYALLGYLVYIPFSMLGGRLSFRPKDENISYSRSLFGKETQARREIPWEGALEVEVEEVGLKVPVLPLTFYRVKVVTDFMTYHVATFAPGLKATANDLAKAVKKARYGGRSRAAQVEALTGSASSSGRNRAIP